METWPLLFSLDWVEFGEKFVAKSGLKSDQKSGQWTIKVTKKLRVDKKFVKKVVILVKNLAIWPFLKKSGQKSVQ